MNERIKLLAEQAKGFVDLNQHVGGTDGCMVYTYDGLEKFAELIVRKCADKAHEFIIEDGDDFPKTSVAYRIKQHFGVEE